MKRLLAALLLTATPVMAFDIGAMSEDEKAAFSASDMADMSKARAGVAVSSRAAIRRFIGILGEKGFLQPWPVQTVLARKPLTKLRDRGLSARAPQA